MTVFKFLVSVAQDGCDVSVFRGLSR
jgi:hypothetical protein